MPKPLLCNRCLILRDYRDFLLKVGGGFASTCNRCFRSLEIKRQQQQHCLPRIYALIDPRTQEKFYIGQTTKNLSARLAGHMSPTSTVSAAPIIREIVSENLMPVIITLQILPIDIDRAHRISIENDWIVKIRGLGGILVNK